MLIVRMKPGEDAPDADNAVVYEVRSGMPGPAFILFQPMAGLSEMPAAHVTAGAIVEDTVYAIEPPLSHVSRDFADRGREFWTNHP